MILFNGDKSLNVFLREQEDGSYQFDEIPIEYSVNNITDVHFGLSQAQFIGTSSEHLEDAKYWEAEAEPYTEQEELDDLPLVVENEILKVRFPLTTNKPTVGAYHLWLLGTTSSGKNVNATICIFIKRQRYNSGSTYSLKEDFLDLDSVLSNIV